MYKRVLLAGRDYPLGLDYVRNRAKKEFRSNANVTDELTLKRKVNYGRYLVREMIGVVQLKKYRTMRSRYYSDEDP